MSRSETTRHAPRGMVCTIDHLASAAGVALLANGGSAADAAVGASAVLAVTSQHMCGMGGDLWALVHRPGAARPAALNASGRSGSGSSAEALRAEGHGAMPFRGDVRSVPIPGCVDGWIALHERFGRLPLADVLAPAVEIAEAGYGVPPIQAAMIPAVADLDGADDYRPGGSPAKAGQRIRRPLVARSLREIGRDGRAAWYEGRFAEGLRRLGATAGVGGGALFSAGDLLRDHADWVDPVRAEAWGRQLWTVPPNSQGYLSLAGAVIAERLDLPDDPADPLWAHLLVESAKQAALDRLEVLHAGADGAALVDEARLGPRRDSIDPARASKLPAPVAGGGTIYLCAVDADRMAVSLMQSNASGFGVHLAVPEVGVFLQNRGIGFSLDPGHPAELAPGRRPPSTLSPALVTSLDDRLDTVLGTMGGDGQPQVVLQMLARRLAAGQAPAEVLDAPRFALTAPGAAGFDTWARRDEIVVAVEAGSGWVEGLRARGHEVREDDRGSTLYGHAQLISVVDPADPDSLLAGAADPRAQIGAAVGL